MRLPVLATVIAGVITAFASASCGDDHAGPFWLDDAHVIVEGLDVIQDDCTKNICPHNENTDLVNFQGAIFLVHRTAESQILDHNCSLRISKSVDGGKTWELLAIIPGPTVDSHPALGDRDLRDPSIFVVGDHLEIKALTRLEHASQRDADVDTVTVGPTSPDGKTWTKLAPIAPATWSFWRVREHAGTFYAAAYEDGDKSIKLFSSTDGLAWTAGAVVFDSPADTVLEPEVVFMPSGRMLVLVRMDGTNDELLGAQGRLRTKVCWAMPPYATFTCPQELDGQRLDGSVAFFHDGRLFVVARKHILGVENKKRTSLFEIGGTLEGGPIDITELGEVPSAGDTAYAGYAELDANRGLITWYSSSLTQDEPWARAILEPSDIWQATIDFSKL